MAELRDRLTLSEIIGRRVKLTRAGREYKGCCPFHNEKTPSFYVNDDKQFYHCFGCGAHGDAVGFVMQNQNLSFIEALESLAAEAGLQVPQQTPQEVEKAKKQKDLYSLMDEAARYFQQALQDGRNREAQSYLNSRGMSAEMISAFRIGYAPEDGADFRRAMLDKGYTAAQMIEAALLRKSNRGTDPYPFFRERVMFPVTDRRGRIVAFGGRILPDHLRTPDRGSFKPPKYLNSSDTPLFHKGRMLYGESQARQAAADGQAVLVVEGYLDVIACFEAGWRGAVAPLGTALTEDQILSLWQMIPQEPKMPYLCFDGDEAGRRAAARACERILPLLKPNHSARIAFLPEGQDPDSLIKAQGKESFAAVLEGAMGLSDFLWHDLTAGRSFDTPEERAGLAKTLEEEADKIADRGVQQYYKQAFKEKLYQAFRYSGGKKGAARNNGGKYSGGTTQGRGAYQNKGRGGQYGGAMHGQSIQVSRPAFAGQALYEKIILAALINHSDLFETVEDDIEHLVMTNKRLDSMRQAIVNLLSGAESNEAIDAEQVRTYLKEQGLESELRAILSESTYTHAGFTRPGTDFNDVLEGWNGIWQAMQARLLTEEMKVAGSALANDFTEENEARILALRQAQNPKEN